MPDDTKNAPRQEFAKIRHAKIEAPDSHDDSCSYVESNDHGSCWRLPSDLGRLAGALGHKVRRRHNLPK
jgi:hypothetical protein